MGTIGKKGIGSHELSPENVRSYVLAGKAILTVQNKETGNHFTYEVTRKGEDDVWFVKVLMENSYVYIGMFTWTGFKTTRSSAVKNDAPSFVVMDIVFKRYVLSFRPHPKLKIMHNGHCARCGRILTHPDSLLTGVGPVCRGM